MFELTIRGMTRQFETAGEMAAWQESMRSKPRSRSKPERKKQKRKGGSLSDKLEELKKKAS